MGSNLRGFDRLIVPEPVADLTTTRVLTMEFVRGQKITSVSPLRRIEVDGAPLARQLFEAYLQQILVDGFFHADPHPGNLFLTDDDRIALLDLGMVGRIPPNMQERLLQLLLAISSGEGEEAAKLAIQLGEPLPSFDEPGFLVATADLVLRYHDTTAEDIEMGRVVVALTRSANEYGIRVPFQVDTPFTILGYPGFAILLFLAAVAGGAYLVIDIMLHDVRASRRKRASPTSGKGSARVE